MDWDDRDLDGAIVRAAAGDRVAFAVLYRAVQPRLLRYLRSRLGDIGDDIASEVWLSAGRSIASFTGSIDEFRAWVFTIARRRMVDQWRRDVRRPGKMSQVNLDEVDDVGAAADVVALDHMGGMQAARLVVSVLPPDQAEVVLLRVLGDLDVDAVARIMDHTPNWVRVTHHRALHRLARCVTARAAIAAADGFVGSGAP